MPDTTDGRTPYHWVMTAETKNGKRKTVSGIAMVAPGGTRQEVFDHVLSEFREGFGAPCDVLFFDLQPNAL